MLYTVLPGLTLCLTLLNGSSINAPMVNVATDSKEISDFKLKYNHYLDAAMFIIEAAKEMKTNQDDRNNENRCKESDSTDNIEVSESKTDQEDSSGNSGNQMLPCPNQPMDCEELMVQCGVKVSGVYRVWPRSRVDTGGGSGFFVFCDMETDGGGWTVFQRRDDFGTNSDFFYKNWLSYKYGFGHLNFDFWLGNDKIFALSNQRRTMLRFDLLDFADEEGYATYDNFYLDDESEGYRLHIGDYRGTIGDSFRGHNLCQFSTRDRDNDRNSAKHCARIYKGGWWYNDCHTANLNGLYLKGTHDSYADGVNWHGWRGFRYSLKKTEMKLRSSAFGMILKNDEDFNLLMPEQ